MSTPSIGSKVKNASTLKYKNYTKAEVAQHNQSTDVWLIIHGKVYDVTNFLEDHPGGPEIITQHAGDDTTAEFEEVFHSPAARKQLADYIVGGLEGFTGDPDAVNRAGKSSAANTATATKAASGGSSTLVLGVGIVVAAAAAAYFIL